MEGEMFAFRTARCANGTSRTAPAWRVPGTVRACPWGRRRRRARHRREMTARRAGHDGCSVAGPAAGGCRPFNSNPIMKGTAMKTTRGSCRKTMVVALPLLLLSGSGPAFGGSDSLGCFEPKTSTDGGGDVSIEGDTDDGSVRAGVSPDEFKSDFL